MKYMVLPRPGAADAAERAAQRKKATLVPVPKVARPPVSHSRTFSDNRLVYAVISRRAHGLSIGVNMNPDKLCNFDCIYCEVDRTKPGRDSRVDIDLMSTDLRS